MLLIGSANGSNMCFLCKIGMWSRGSKQGAASCEQCATGKFNMHAGETKCYKCKPGLGEVSGESYAQERPSHNLAFFCHRSMDMICAELVQQENTVLCHKLGNELVNCAAKENIVSFQDR